MKNHLPDSKNVGPALRLSSINGDMFKHVSHVTLRRSESPSAPPTGTTYFAQRPCPPLPRPSNFPTFLGHAPSVKGPIHEVNAALGADRALGQDVWLIPRSAKANKSPKYDY